jgi:hypothetical protein
MTSEQLFSSVPLTLFRILWPLTLALFMFKARNEEWSPEEGIADVGRCLPGHQVRASHCQRIDGKEHASAGKFFGEENGP